MTRKITPPAALLTLFAVAWALASPVRADVEIAHPDGRRVLLKDDGTWRYVEAKDQEQPAEKAKQEGEAVLLLERTIDKDPGCTFVVVLVNNLPYEIRSIVPEFSAYRADGVIYKTLSVAPSFSRLSPGDMQRRQIQFPGIACGNVARLKVGGAERCDMGELNKWSDAKGACLERVRVEASDLLPFDK